MTAEVKSILCELQDELMRLNQWQTLAPEPERLASELPFCMDTLTLYEWLQWIYIARLNALVDAHLPLPKGAHVQPYAEEALKADGVSSPRLVDLIGQLDKKMA
ncbi:YqcC family protein [Reinekea marina]|uniref:YqcC family protein n=1 Tax=Reinekea marina TaxID=1310421 RepID=A0ABV7WTC3_9GAMM|nr:YqcC family protein [Reinekea marina]MDN3648794.1 YqcC family protein [Reinekea marina]